ncbi:MAG: hypothetical protein FIB06_00665 [Betaproteobacteria bacterium]|nr:hypothetical protein [Betaproteobacteria bacterium]
MRMLALVLALGLGKLLDRFPTVRSYLERTRVVDVFLLLVVLTVWLVAFPAHAQETPTAADLAVMGIDAATVLAVWSWGFGTVIFCWYLGFVAGLALKAIRQS